MRFSIICSLRKKYKKYFDTLLIHISGQNYKDFECIFIIDEDDIDYLDKLDDRFRIIKVPEQWLATKRNIGIEEAYGDYIIFCDADDYLDINLLNVFSNVIDKHNPDIVFPLVTRDESMMVNNINYSYDLYNTKDDVIHFFFSRYVSSMNRGGKFVKDGCWGRAFKRKTLIDNHIRFVAEPCRAEDAIFNNDVALVSSILCTLPYYYGYFWRKNNTSEMNNINSLFYNVVPFGENLTRQISQIDKKYEVNIIEYLSTIVISQIMLFLRAHQHHQISFKEMSNKIESFIVDDSKCREYLETYIKETKIPTLKKCLLTHSLRGKYRNSYCFYILEKLKKKVYRILRR